MRTPARRQPLWALSLAASALALPLGALADNSGGGSANAASTSGSKGSAAPTVLATAAGDLSSVYAPDVTVRFQRAAQLFEQARAGSAAAVGPAQDAFKDLLQADSSNPLFVAYYGSTFAMRARDGGAPWQKIKWVNEGINNIDHALALLGPQYEAKTMRGVPIGLETRLVAIATYIPLPSLFNRMGVARQQLAQAMGSPSFAGASDELRGRFYYEDALIAHSDGDTEHERRALREVVKDAPPSLNMNEVREQLAKLGG